MSLRTTAWLSARPGHHQPVQCLSSPEKPRRRSANYQPTSWDYDALLSLDSGRPGDQVHPSSYYKMKRRIRDMLLKKVEPSSKLQTIDAMQRLGISYHFEDEISNILYSISNESTKAQYTYDNIAFTALKFRLLRENGFPTILGPLGYHNYEKFITKTPSLEDANTLLLLYEASYLAFGDEEKLDVARTFSAKALKQLMPFMLPHLREGVAHSLELPLHWRASRLETRWFIDYYARDRNMCPLLLQFAELDFNQVQYEHQKDLAVVTRWWKKIGLGEKLPFARDRLMECFHYANGIVWDPKLGTCRQMLAKVSNLIVYLDDLYDVYGTIEELVLFTNAIARWDAIPNETLPEYMKALYSIIYDTSNEVAEHALKKHGCSMHYLLQKSWYDICLAFLVEAKWHHGNYRPSIQKYLENGWVSSSAPLLLLHAFAMLDSVVNMSTISPLQTKLRLVQHVSLILRLCNDSATHLDELGRGDAPSFIALHMIENGGNENDSRKAMQEHILKSWKVINEEAFDSCQYSMPFNKACIDLARISHCVYQGGDGFGTPNGLKKKQIRDLFLDPIDICNKQ
ncbi:(-)-alpha-terpineol synthase [Zea mays]|uniref:Uncharacterized protein n=2 Tax=Zea mays TaxID=4577 RepID=C4J581_MAIZE|nr:(-)-alpha-terpineol synthase [Zea mays]ACR36331.1 unknown [Zea mays]|eukprot:NP_001183298.1 uncharacterized protein LOC100501694 [Zea mays]